MDWEKVMSDELTNIHTIEVMIKHHPGEIIKLSIPEHHRFDAMIDLARQMGLSFQVHERCSALVQRRKPKRMEELSLLMAAHEKGLVLCLDGVVDPHNFGACMRSAAAFGVLAVVVPQDRACPLNATVRNIACGGAECTPVFSVVNLTRMMRDAQQQGWWVYGSSEHADKSIKEVQFDTKSIVVLGNEGSGLRANTEKNCDELFHLPTKAPIKSLNVAVSTGVVLYSIV